MSEFLVEMEVLQFWKGALWGAGWKVERLTERFLSAKARAKTRLVLTDPQKVLGAHGITCSMSRRGNCYGNAAMESWFSTLKFELSERYATRAEPKEKLFDYIEVFYNQQRRHSSLDALDYASPAGNEKAARESRASAQSTCPPDRIKPRSFRAQFHVG
jgi:transposase InsO family protein